MNVDEGVVHVVLDDGGRRKRAVIRVRIALSIRLRACAYIQSLVFFVWTCTQTKALPPSLVLFLNLAMHLQRWPLLNRITLRLGSTRQRAGDGLKGTQEHMQA